MNKPIVIVGGFGFIGSNLVEFCNKNGVTPFVVEKTSEIGEKWHNVNGLDFILTDVDRIPDKATIVHLGANVDTTETMNPTLWKNNVDFAHQLYFNSIKKEGKFIYASSAAVYGAEEKDFSERIAGAKALNAYGFTKAQLDQSFFGNGRKAQAYGLRFFNVFGPRENHKGRMASVVHKALTKQKPIHNRRMVETEKGIMAYQDGSEWSLFEPADSNLRDFVFVEDVCRVIWWFIQNDPEYGVYNLGTGKTRSFDDIVKTVDPTLPIKYIPLPADLSKQYQKYTCADITKLRAAGYAEPFTSLEDGITKTRAYLEENPV